MVGNTVADGLDDNECDDEDERLCDDDGGVVPCRLLLCINPC